MDNAVCVHHNASVQIRKFIQMASFLSNVLALAILWHDFHHVFLFRSRNQTPKFREFYMYKSTRNFMEVRRIRTSRTHMVSRLSKSFLEAA